MSVYYQSIIDRGGGLITLGNYLGVMVAPHEDAVSCPPGWGFVDINGATPELIAECCREVPLRMAEYRSSIEKSKL